MVLTNRRVQFASVRKGATGYGRATRTTSARKSIAPLSLHNMKNIMRKIKQYLEAESIGDRYRAQMQTTSFTADRSWPMPSQSWGSVHGALHGTAEDTPTTGWRLVTFSQGMIGPPQQCLPCRRRTGWKITPMPRDNVVCFPDCGATLGVV